jgi:hypothetical protein
LKAFVSSKKSDKREALVRNLLSRNEAYAKNWLSFWNDLLRNDYQGTGYIDGGREQITRWLYSALLTNMPYDKFVAELISPSPASEGFSKGILWRGFVNASQMPQMQAAQNVSQVFMGVNLKCASCHDSFINDWQLSDAYGLANVFSDQPLEIYRCDVPTGQAGGDQVHVSATGRACRPPPTKWSACARWRPSSPAQRTDGSAHDRQPSVGQISRPRVGRTGGRHAANRLGPGFAGLAGAGFGRARL